MGRNHLLHCKSLQKGWQIQWFYLQGLQGNVGKQWLGEGVEGQKEIDHKDIFHLYMHFPNLFFQKKINLSLAPAKKKKREREKK